jgi:hypothetical protein
MLVKNNSICFVASTLPVGFIVSQVDSLKIKKIIVVSQSLEGSYLILKKKYPYIEIVQAPSGFLIQPIYFFAQLLAVKLNKNSVIIFHECCIPLLDLLLKLVKPTGYYFPQVTMRSFEEIKFAQYPKTKLTVFLNVFGLVSYFKLYRAPPVGDYEPEYALSIREYPGSIVVKDVQFSRELISKYYSEGSSKTKKILFVIGKTCVSNLEQINIFQTLAEFAYSKGYACYIKDHPNPIYRLDLQIDNTITIDPLVPVELLERDYSWIVGVSSSALLSFGDRSISILNLFEGMSSDDRIALANHYINADPENKINFINSLDEFKGLLNNTAC